MNELFANIPNIGELLYFHTYLFYDEPQIFSCISKTMQKFFLAAIPPENDAESAWLLVPISSGKLSKLEKNLIEIRDAFLAPESLLWKIEQNNDQFDSTLLPVASLADDMLPYPGELLDYNDAHELETPTSTTLAQSQQEMRDVIEISLERDDQHISEIPCSTLGEVLNNVQQLVYAIAYKDGGLSGPIPRKVKENCALCISGMFAASVGVRLKSNEMCDIFGETPLTAVLRDFNCLFNSVSDREKLKDFLSTQNPKVAVKYRTFIKTLISSKIGIKIDNASPDDSCFTKHFTTKELAANLELINSQIEEIVESKKFYGTLVGINVERDTFEFISSDGESIKGVLSGPMKGTTFSVPQVVEADIEIRVGTDSMTKEEKLVFTLLGTSPVVSE